MFDSEKQVLCFFAFNYFSYVWPIDPSVGISITVYVYAGSNYLYAESISSRSVTDYSCGIRNNACCVMG